MRLASREIERLDRPMSNITSWRSGILRFDGVPMDQVFRDLERYYRVEFEFEGDALSTCTLKADFEAAPIGDVIETIEFSLGWQLEQKNDVYYVKGSSCNNAKE
jgi:ferric-dicitrate binding protein FerR (iron transport regulator)